MLSLRQMVLIKPDRAGNLTMPASTSPQLRIPASAPTHHTHLELRPAPSAVPAARHHTRAVLFAWGLGAIADDVQLVVSELVTNAIEATASLPEPVPIELDIAEYPGQLLLQVCDASPDLPAQRQPDDTAPNGRGLHIINNLSSAWGYTRQPQGKSVWASLGLTRPAA